MYRLVFGRPDNFAVLKSGTLVECFKARVVSGDLILTPSGEVLQGETWLFDWEKRDPNCYARRMQANGWTR